jgi:IclR family acetate operon transcriptional repressor
MIVKQAANVLDILEFFARIKRPVTLTEIAQEFGWPRSSTFNMVGTLVERGFLYEPKPRTGYYPTPRWLTLSRQISEAEPLPPSLHRLLLDLVRETGETAYVAAPAGDRVVFLDVVESESPIRYFAEIGKRLPIHATATGKAILAQYSPSERQSVLGKIKFERYQPNTPMSIAAVEAPTSWGCRSCCRSLAGRCRSRSADRTSGWKNAWPIWARCCATRPGVTPRNRRPLDSALFESYSMRRGRLTLFI